MRALIGTTLSSPCCNSTRELLHPNALDHDGYNICLLLAQPGQTTQIQVEQVHPMNYYLM
jgi:hypothetical protein